MNAEKRRRVAVRWLGYGRPPTKLEDRLSKAVGAGLPILLWVVFFTARREPGEPITIVVIGGIATAGLLLLPILSASRGHPPRLLLAGVAYALSVMVGIFASTYWDAGSTRNWGVPLSRLDALYVALGTLTTAGTGQIAPRTETARGLVTAQLIVEVVLVPILLGVVVFAVSELRQNSALKRSNGQAAAVTPADDSNSAPR